MAERYQIDYLVLMKERIRRKLILPVAFENSSFLILSAWPRGRLVGP